MSKSITILSDSSLEARLAFETFMGDLSFRFINVPINNIDLEIRNSLTSTMTLFGFNWAVLAERKLNTETFTLIQTVCRDKLPAEHQIAALVLSQGHIARMFREQSLTITRLTDIAFNGMAPVSDNAKNLECQAMVGIPFGSVERMTGFVAFGTRNPEVVSGSEQGQYLNRVGHLLESVLVRRTAAMQFDELFRFERLLSEISSTFSGVSAEEVDRTIEFGLTRISTFMGADYSNLVPFTINNKEVGNIVYAWVREGIPPLPDFKAPLKELFPWFAEKFRQGKVVHFSRLEDLPEASSVDRLQFNRMGSKSHVSVPINVGRTIAAVLSIGTISTHRFWSGELVQRLRLVGEIFTNAIMRKEKQLEIQTAFSQIEQLNAQLEAECTYLREEIELSSDFHNMIGQSEAFKKVISQVGRIAATDVTVLIHGETGTGKELVAQAIHSASPRKHRPMVKVNCAALPENLIESELFGHEKGAFTSAQQRQIGRFELANKSTLFLDEIGELSLASQSKLLRVLQEGEFERLGSSSPQRVDVRIIAATNRDLEKEVRKGRFRQDLWYRLNVFPISVPPLRERSEDVPLLVNWFILKSAKKLGETIERISAKTMKELQCYNWPGNVRELENVIERAVINSPHTSLQLADKLDGSRNLPEEMADRPTLDEMARAYIVQILEATKGRIEGPHGAALILGLHPSTLRARMLKLGIKVGKFVD